MKKSKTRRDGGWWHDLGWKCKILLLEQVFIRCNAIVIDVSGTNAFCHIFGGVLHMTLLWYRSDAPDPNPPGSQIGSPVSFVFSAALVDSRSRKYRVVLIIGQAKTGMKLHHNPSDSPWKLPTQSVPMGCTPLNPFSFWPTLVVYSDAPESTTP